MNKTPFFFFLFLSQFSIAQNLVPNPSFEIYDTCPDNNSQINRATGWTSVRPTPDYYNSCGSLSSVSVPNNFLGYQYPASGNGYAGFEGKNQFYEAKEYIGAQLMSQLQIGTKYYISLKVNLSDRNYSCGINKLGVLFSTIQYSDGNVAPICNCAQVYTDSIITDSLNWTRIKGSFIADSNYSFINIGNFFTDLLTDSIQLNGNTCFAYYYLDDVCVSTDSAYSYSYTWTTEGINENNNQPNIFVYPNPSIDYINIDFSFLSEPYNINIYDMFGREIFFKQEIIEPKERIPIGNIDSHVLFIKITYRNQSINYKLIKI